MINSRSIRNEIVETGDFRKLKMKKQPMYVMGNEGMS